MPVDPLVASTTAFDSAFSTASNSYASFPIPSPRSQSHLCPFRSLGSKQDTCRNERESNCSRTVDLTQERIGTHRKRESKDSVRTLYTGKGVYTSFPSLFFADTSFIALLHGMIRSDRRGLLVFHCMQPPSLIYLIRPNVEYLASSVQVNFYALAFFCPIRSACRKVSQILINYPS
ncbi:hypothetical protein GYMLUDRAFT_922649 [Collybiopsis luxurians FD-317 M1]|uniref:Uncharacterized protein n=1 Tax=Collybiopsis luxurians FD-317 M1 TaxID=944289 RepID=A0A0D0BW91_9AGAR|nr:hypothetical protein GYMLUDRAFT_922649 [Collybiopsis luxurians FD-317 M1]